MPPRQSKTAAKPETPSAGRRRSQRVSTSASADKKSKYFQAESEGSEAEGEKPTSAPKKRGRPASAKKGPPAKRVKKAAESEEEEADETPFEEEESQQEEEEEEEEEVKPVKKAARGRKPKAVVHQDKVEKANVGKRRVAKPVADSDAEDVVEAPTKKPGRGATKKTQQQPSEVDDDDEEDARPKAIFIPHAKIRDDGGVPYTDEVIHPNTLEFLKDLKANNVRSWLKSNDGEFRRALKDWESYATSLTDTIIDLDPTIPELPFKDINFRIYRDIRFTNDPTPYKPHFSAAWSRTGRKGPYACYYAHMEPGGSSFIGGGLWHPSAPSLAALRTSIDTRPERWRATLSNPTFITTFFPDVTKKAKKGESVEEAAVAAFAKGNAGSALKTKPKGYEADHRDIELLKLRSFTVSKKVPDGWWTSEEGRGEVARVVGAMVGFVGFLNRVVMPDPGEESEEEEEGEDGEEEDGEDGE